MIFPSLPLFFASQLLINLINLTTLRLLLADLSFRSLCPLFISFFIYSSSSSHLLEQSHNRNTQSSIARFSLIASLRSITRLSCSTLRFQPRNNLTHHPPLTMWSSTPNARFYFTQAHHLFLSHPTPTHRVPVWDVHATRCAGGSRFTQSRGSSSAKLLRRGRLHTRAAMIKSRYGGDRVHRFR